MINSVCQNTSLVCGAIAAFFGVYCVLLKIKLKKKEIELAELNKAATERSATEFSDLVGRLDTKINSFWTLLLNKTGQHVPHGMYGAQAAPFSFATSPTNEVSLFSYRAAHYTEEKRLVCKRFLHELASNPALQNKAPIYLFIDSGSTLFPVFNLLCEYYWTDQKPYASVIRNISIITNNIPGVQVMISKGRKGSNATADTVIPCRVIPGKVEAKYSAILSQEGVNHVAFAVDEIIKNEPNSALVALLTGNYISIPDGILWRGEFHGQMKNALVHSAQHVYLLSPLGKIFNKTHTQLNDIIQRSRYYSATSKNYKTLVDDEAALRFTDAPKFTEGAIQKLLPSALSSTRNIHLITTKRSARDGGVYPGALLEYFSEIHGLLQDRLGANLIFEPFAPHIDAAQTICELQIYRDEIEAFLNYEFPHQEIRAAIRTEIFQR
jgi:hypothetical protein